MAQLQGFAFVEEGGAVGLSLVVVFGCEWICGEESVGADVPAGRKAEAGGMIEECDAEVFALDGAMIIAPARGFSPCVFVEEALAVLDLASLLRINGH